MEITCRVYRPRRARESPLFRLVYGPEPADERRHPIDHEHYVEKQLRAVAEPVLALLGQDFAHVSGSSKQLSLF